MRKENRNILEFTVLDSDTGVVLKKVQEEMKQQVDKNGRKVIRWC